MQYSKHIQRVIMSLQPQLVCVRNRSCMNRTLQNATDSLRVVTAETKARRPVQL